MVFVAHSPNAGETHGPLRNGVKIGYYSARSPLSVAVESAILCHGVVPIEQIQSSRISSDQNSCVQARGRYFAGCMARSLLALDGFTAHRSS
jgi:hypothetical protein